MTSDVVLSAALRSNLLSLQGTQSLIDNTQLRLSTGRKVNSALDNPQSFFASQALTNRANDLTRLLDGIGQSIQVIKAADNGVTALTKLVEQADSIATSARDSISSGAVSAKISGTKDLSSITDFTTQTVGIDAGDTAVLSLTDTDGTVEQIGTTVGTVGNTFTLTFRAPNGIAGAGDIASSTDLINKINSLVNASGDKVFTASLDSTGKLQITAEDGRAFRLSFVDSGGAANIAQSQAIADELGIGLLVNQETDGTAAGIRVAVTATANTELRSFKFIDQVLGTTITARASSLLSSLGQVGSPATDEFVGSNAGDEIQIALNGGSFQTITGAATLQAHTVQDIIDSINNNTVLGSKIEAAFDDTTGQFVIRATDGSVKTIQFRVLDNTGNDARANFGFGSAAVTLNTTAANASQTENILFASGAGELASLEDQYDSVLSQIDALVSNGDTGYRGTNLLNGDDLLTVFNEDRTSTLTTSGVDFTSNGLALDAADFRSADAIDEIIEQVRTALTSVRNFGNTIANDLAVIQTRQDFTSELVNTLKTGSDLLVNADQNEEGAKLLALQTRQQLGVTALSLASQSQQSILRLF